MQNKANSSKRNNTNNARITKKVLKLDKKLSDVIPIPSKLLGIY